MYEISSVSDHIRAAAKRAEEFLREEMYICG
jgi:hypothetical protein